ncbi:MAG: GldG family protein [Treponema sp.]|jgi:ABC-type uncharacterized transport system involved in gliding motility auxiliary subunit|nr:GldG family protein [Treponema sp.]
MKNLKRVPQFTPAFLWAIIILLLFLISSRLYIRLDITKNRANTLSEFSKKLIRNLDEPLIITYFVSDRLGRVHSLPGQISDLIEEYSAASSGMIRFTRKDPQKHGLFRELEGHGIFPRQMEIFEKNESILAPVYSAVLIEYLDRLEVLPSVFSLDSLEYELSSGILSLVMERKRELGIIAGGASNERSAEYKLLYQEFTAAGFNVNFIGQGEEIPPNLDCVFVLGGAEYLDEWDLFCIDNFIQSGRGVFFAVDAVTIDFENGLSARPTEDQGLLAMLASYGIVVQQALVLDRSCLNLNYQTRNPDGSTEINTIRYPLWIEVSQANKNQKHPLSSGFRGLDLYWASPLELFPAQGMEPVPLFFSSEEAWLQTRNFAVDFNGFSFYEDEREETVGTKILGASLAGNNGARLIVVGGSDFAGTLMSATMAEIRNTDFLVRSAAWLSGDDGLLEIRKRGEEAFRLDKIQNPQKRNAAKDFSRIINVFVLPALVIVAGFFAVRKGSGK